MGGEETLTPELCDSPGCSEVDADLDVEKAVLLHAAGEYKLVAPELTDQAKFLLFCTLSRYSVVGVRRNCGSAGFRWNTCPAHNKPINRLHNLKGTTVSYKPG